MYLKDLPNDALVVMAGVLKNIQSKYIKEDGPTGPGNAPASSSVDELRAEARTIMMKPEYTNAFHPNHEQVKKDLADVYDRMRPLMDANKK